MAAVSIDPGTPAVEQNQRIKTGMVIDVGDPTLCVPQRAIVLRHGRGRDDYSIVVRYRESSIIKILTEVPYWQGRGMYRIVSDRRKNKQWAKEYCAIDTSVPFV